MIKKNKMRIKMSFESLSEIAGQFRTRTTRIECEGKNIFMNVLINKKANNKKTLSITLGGKVLKTSKILVGDRVDVLIDKKEKLLLIKRTVEGGYKITKSGSNTIKNGRIQLTAYKGFPVPEKRILLDNITYPDQGILCELPNDIKFLE